MKSDEVKIIVLVSVLSFAAGWMIGFFRSSTTCETLVRCDTLKVNDTIRIESPVMVKEKFVPLEVKIDTEEIVRAYQMERVFHDTVYMKDYGYISLIDTVYNNTLTGRDVVLDLNFPQSNKKFALGIGGSVGKECAEVNAHFRFKRWTFEGGYDVMRRGIIGGIKYDLWQW